MSDFDVFAKKIQFPRSAHRLPQTFFADRIQAGRSTHIRAFAAEVLTAVNVLAMLVQLVVKPAGIMIEHVQCSEAMQRLFAIFKKGYHRFSADVFSFSYKKPCSTALAFDVRRLFQAANDPKTFQMYVLGGNAVAWGNDAVADLGEPWERATLIASSTEIVTRVGRFLRNDLVEWHGKRLGFCKAFFRMILTGNCTVHAAVVD